MACVRVVVTAGYRVLSLVVGVDTMYGTFASTAARVVQVGSMPDQAKPRFAAQSCCIFPPTQLPPQAAEGFVVSFWH